MDNPFLRKITNCSVEPSKKEFYDFLKQVMLGKTTRQEVSAFLAGISARPLSTECMLNFISFIHEYSPPKILQGSEGAVNIVGTGGGIRTFNISTASAIVASAAGAKVLKSGSTAYNSQCGSLDVLRALEVPMVNDQAELSDMVEELGIGFIPSSHYSKIIQRLAAIVVPLVFRDIAGFINKVGPLLCPYQVSAQVIGVSQPEYLSIFSGVVSQLQCAKTLLVQAEIGLDEFSSIGVNHCRLIDEKIKYFSFSNTAEPVSKQRITQLEGGDILKNTVILREILSGKRKGEARDTVVLNSAAVLYMAGITPTIEAGIKRAGDVIDQGKAIYQLESIISWGRERMNYRFSLATAC